MSFEEFTHEIRNHLSNMSSHDLEEITRMSVKELLQSNTIQRQLPDSTYGHTISPPNEQKKEIQLPDLTVRGYAKFKMYEHTISPSDKQKSDIEIKLINKTFCTDVEIYLNGKLVDTNYCFDTRGNRILDQPAIIKKYNLSSPLTQLGISYFSRIDCRKCDPDSPKNYENIFYISDNIYSFRTSVFKPFYDKNDDGTVIRITTIIPDDMMSFTISNNISEIYEIFERENDQKRYYNLVPEYNKFGAQLWDRQYEELLVRNITKYIEFINFIKSEINKLSKIPTCEFQTAKNFISNFCETSNQIMDTIEPITPPENNYNDFTNYNDIKTNICENLKITHDIFQDLTEEEIKEIIQDSQEFIYYYMFYDMFNHFINQSIKYIKDRKYKIHHIDISYLKIENINQYY